MMLTSTFSCMEESLADALLVKEWDLWQGDPVVGHTCWHSSWSTEMSTGKMSASMQKFCEERFKFCLIFVKLLFNFPREVSLLQGRIKCISTVVNSYF